MIRGPVPSWSCAQCIYHYTPLFGGKKARYCQNAHDTLKDGDKIYQTLRVIPLDSNETPAWCPFLSEKDEEKT